MNKLRLFMMALLTEAAISINAQVTPVSQMEKLDRGLVAVPVSATSNFVSWRLLGTDNKAAISFDLLRDGSVIASGLTKTNYQDNAGSASSKYQVVTKVNGETVEISAEIQPWAAKYKTLKLDRPQGGTDSKWTNSDVTVGPTSATYAYYPNDMSVGDVDGDGQYELFLKWESTHAQDNSRSLGATGNTIIDCYKMDGTRLWRIDLGKNIRDGAHYTQFMVYDFDGDGKAEMMCKTATGSVDGLGNYVNQAATDATIKGHDNTKDYRNSGGHILSGPEYLTVFEGLTGKAIHTTWYLPGRAGTGDSGSTLERGVELGKVSTFPSGFWGDNYGGRSERFLAAVAYINGADKPACGIFCRGYYSKAYVWAVSFDGTRLHTEWLHASPNSKEWLVFASKWEDGQAGLEYTIDGDKLKRIPIKTASANTSGAKSSDGTQNVGSNTLFGNGNHNMSVADVDGDGCDEILWGAGALNNDGSLLYATGYGHGDAIHVGKMIPDREGYQVFDVHEEKLVAAHGSWDLHDARTGEIIWHGGNAGADNGRGMAGDLTGQNGYEFWSSDEHNPRNAVSGATAINKSCSVNYRIYWDGSCQDQLFDGSYKYSNSDSWAQTAHAEPVITKWNGSSFSTIQSFYSEAYKYAQTANYTKATPCLQADILGDWREELIMWNKKDSAEIMIFSTWTPTEYAVPTLMHDHTYRMGVAWQNTAYNQPPHLGYYLPDYINGKITGIIGIHEDKNTGKQDGSWYTLSGMRLNGMPTQKGLYIKNGRKIVIK
ncbi:MAG: rhamnogalacturonan lyase [Prevotella sp.]|nr:rhamnogalacturonan lyase [Prevotella sp.]